MMHNLKHFLIFVLSLSSACLFGQFTVETNILLAPPYPTNLDAYVDYLEEGIIEINNLNNEAQEVYYSVLMEETSGKISVSTDGILGEVMTIQPGINILTPSEIQSVFSGLTEANFNSSGLSQAERDAIMLNRQMPEGNYRICIQAFNEMGVQMSDPSLGCVTFDIFFAERPIILSPFDGEESDTSGFLFVTWDHTINSLGVVDRLEYTVKIIDLTEQAVINPQLAMLDPGLSPEYEEELGNVFSVNLLHDVDMPLIIGHQYAIRVTATDPDDGLGFQFGGHSEVVVFRYGEEVDVEDPIEESELLAAPIIITPENGFIDMPEDPLAIPLEWSHTVEDDALKPQLTYTVKVVDMDSLRITNVDIDDFKNDNYEYIWNMSLTVDLDSDTSTQVLMSSAQKVLVRNHKYALAVFVESEDNRLTWQDDGYSNLVIFEIGKEEDEDDEEAACGGDCLTELPTDQTEVAITNNTAYFMGKLSLFVEQALPDQQGGYKGKGYVAVNFFKQVKINVTFSGLKANKEKYIFDGTADAVFDDSTVKADGLVAFGASSTLNLDFEKAKALSNALRSTGKLVSAFAGKQTSLPLGFDRDVDGDKMIVGITEMNFTPKKATLTALFSLENPEWGDYVPTLGASNICFTNNGFGQVVKLFLGSDYSIPMSNEKLVLKASENNDKEEKGTYCIVDCNGFKEGQITGQIGLPREMLLPEEEDGSITEEGFATMTLSGNFKKSNGFMLSASLSPCQIPGLEGFSLVMENGVYDASDDVNPVGLKFPQGYTREETDKTWKGVWFGNLLLKAPRDWGFASDEERTSVGIKDFIKDNTGISIVAGAQNLLSIDKGEFEGFAISIDEIKLNIIRGEFKNVKIEGQIGLPILPDEKYLSYEGIVDRDKKEDGKENKGNTGSNAVAGEALSMSFVVKPDEEGYDIDWLKSHIDFDSTSQFILENNNKRRGFSATLGGKISIKGNGLDATNANQASGMPEVDIPGLKFEGMEISRMIDKSDAKGSNNGKNSTGGFTFTRPVLSFNGTSFANLTGANGIPDREDAPEEEEDEEKEPKMNGFSLTLEDVQFEFGGGDSEAESQEITNGSALELMVKPNITLVGRQGQKNKAGKDKGFAITVEGKFVIEARVEKKANKMTFAYENLRLDSLGVQSEIGPIEIEGSLGFYNGDAKFGDGVVGDIAVKVPLLDVKLEGRFGKMNAGATDEYAYWYLFGDVSKEMKPGGLPLVKVGQYFSLYGFHGGAYYHMNDAIPGGRDPKTRYVPDDDISLGLKAGIKFSVTEPNVLWAKTTFGIQFKKDYSLDRISFEGDAYMLQLEPKEATGAEIDGIMASLYAAVNVKKIDDKTEVEFDANLKIYANIADGLIQGNMDQSRPNLVAESLAHVDAEKWSFIMGTPSKPGSVQVGIPDLATVNAKAYLMAGKGVEFETATLHPFISGLLYGSNPDLKGNKATGNENTRTSSNGFAMGMNIDYNLDIKASILYAQFRAMFGFDLSMIEQPGVTCSNTGGSEIGMGGYYAQGQVFAGFRGDMGLDVDLWIYTGKISLAEVYAAMMIQGGLPNPIWAKGSAVMGFSVLGGLLEGEVGFDVEVGEKCVKEQANPFTGKRFIADIDPGDRTKNINVYVNPRVSFENRLGEYNILTPPDVNGNRKNRTFDVRLEKTELRRLSNSAIVSMSKTVAWDKLSARLRTSEILPAYTDFQLTAVVAIYEKINGSYQKLMDKGEHVTEEKVIKFRTGARPDYLSIDNIQLLYPHKGAKYYLKGENWYQECYLQLDKKQNELWQAYTPAGKEWHNHVVAKVFERKSWGAGELVHEAPLKFANYYKVVYFSLPSQKLDNSKKYIIRLVREHYRNSAYDTSGEDIADVSTEEYTYKKEGKTYKNYSSAKPLDKTVFSYMFRVSKYNTFEEKVEGSTYAYETRTPTSAFHGNGVTYVIENDEAFSIEELLRRYLSSNQTSYGGMMRIEEKYTGNNNQYVNLMYMLRMSKALAGRISSTHKFPWQEKWKFKTDDVRDGLVYNDQISDLLKMPYDRDDSRFWFNTLDMLTVDDVLQFSSYVQAFKYIYPEYHTVDHLVFENATSYRVNRGMEFALSKPSDAKDYEVKLSYRPPYLSREWGYIKSYDAGTVIKKYRP